MGIKLLSKYARRLYGRRKITNVKRISVLWSLLFLVLALMLPAGYGGSDVNPEAADPLSADNINLTFVVSPDLANIAEGGIYPDTWGL